MKPRAIVNLDQLPDEQFFREISSGLNLILENASRLNRDVELLEENGRYNGGDILLSFAEEELAKFFILLDAVRCPKSLRSRQLTKFIQHLPKGIYPIVYKGRYETFGEIEELVKSLCQRFYLDGPTGADWIFRNWVIQQREQAMYVDYAETDQGNVWIAPTEAFGTDRWAEYLLTAHSLKDVGCTTPESLEAIANFWREIQMTADFHWSTLQELNLKMLEELEDRHLLVGQNSNVYGTIVDGWLFPLYQLEMKQNEVKIEELRKIQKNLTP